MSIYIYIYLHIDAMSSGFKGLGSGGSRDGFSSRVISSKVTTRASSRDRIAKMQTPLNPNARVKTLEPHRP